MCVSAGLSVQVNKGVCACNPLKEYVVAAMKKSKQTKKILTQFI